MSATTQHKPAPVVLANLNNSKENKMPKKVTVIWPDTKQVEEGVEMNRDASRILFHSNFDNSINWVPKEYIKSA
jgi:hypothetical protein